MFKQRLTTQQIVVHCTATRPDMDVGAEWIDGVHRTRPDMRCPIGYHGVIRRGAPRFEQGRPWDAIGAHSRGNNHNSVGLVLAGGVDNKGRAENNFLAAQFDLLEAVLLTLQARYGKLPVVGHRDLSPDLDGDGVVERNEWLKECPCFDVQEWWAGRMATHWSGSWQS